MIKTSVIIPMYNTQEYIGECLENIFAQTQKEIEIIAVDDGSTDGSLEILKGYQKEHENLIILCQENKKQGAARNAGVRVARGECVYFLDSDDLIKEDALEVLYQKLMDHQLDFVSFDAEAFGDMPDEIEKFRYYDRSETRIDPEKVYSGFDFWNQFYLDHNPMITPWSFYFRKDFLDIYDIRFQENLFFEDVEFAVKVYLKSERMMYMPRKLYQRRIRQGSVMHSKFELPHLNGVLSNTKLICKYINEDWHTFEEKYLFLKFWKAQFTKIIQKWNEVEGQKDKRTMDLAGGIIDELVQGTFLLKYLDNQFYVELQRFLGWLLEEAYYPKNMVKLKEVLEGWYVEKAGLCVYGAGKIAEIIAFMLQTGEIKRKRIIFAVTENRDKQKEYQGYPLIEIKDLPQYDDMVDIIIATTKYEDEMLEEIHTLFGNAYSVRMYRDILAEKVKKVSLIVPTYNGEKYLKRCLSSLVRQTYKNIEIIIVNDGSTDDSLAISKIFSENDKRCTVIDQENKGVTAARQVGVKKASGDLLMFVDCDDWLEENAVCRMIALQGKRDSDIVVTGHIRETGDEGKKEIGYIPKGIYSGSMLKPFYRKMFYVSPISGWGIWPTLWAKLYKREIVKKAIEKIDSRIIYGEDTAAVFTAFFGAENIIVSEEFLYHYFVANENSASKTKDKNLLESMYYLINYMKGLFMEQDEKAILLKQLEWYTNNVMNHISRVMFDIPYHMWEVVHAQKEAEQWKRRYTDLKEAIERSLNQQEWILPYQEFKSMKSIVVFGSGSIAESYAKHLEYDNNYTLLMHMRDISEIKKLSNISYDCILIATDDIHEKCVMEMELLKRGVDEKKIIWKEPFKG